MKTSYTEHFLRWRISMRECKSKCLSPLPFGLQIPPATSAEATSKSRLSSSLKSIHNNHVNLEGLIPKEPKHLTPELQ